MPRISPPAVLLSLGLAGCSGSELVGVHVDLAKDGSGVVTTRALVSPEVATVAEVRSAGTAWNLRAALVCSQGTFRSIADLKLGDGGIRFVPQIDGDRPGLRVHLQRGPGAAWIQALVPDEPTRRAMARAYDPTGRTREIGDVLRIEISTPGRVITSGVLPTGRGVVADRDGRRAHLLLPVRTALEGGDDFVWDVTWL